MLTPETAMRLRTVLSIAVFVALAACDSKGPPKVGASAPQAGAAVTVPVNTAPPPAGAACPDPATIIAKACPPATVGKAPAKPVKVHRHHPPKKRPPVRVAAAAPAPVAAPPREYARVEAPPPPPARPQRRVQEEVVESFSSYGPPPAAFAPPPQMSAPQPAYAYAPQSGPCCTYPAAGRDANGFLTWPGQR